ncbi:HipA domain-containing protein [Bradyrhizobium cajani]|uniref:HipA domain-containing protein n=1 Tax=Bradyrhizobium cajani TaxID=1928661 RepID=UPI0020B2564F|nr:HipA domain-containing protein [Bradyrhizobium cajani]MCP3367670.1 HipA domain-containing protein [Bradyrhizobium cajani]
MALLLRALDVLGIPVDANSGAPTSRGSTSAVDINAIVTKAKKRQDMMAELIALLDGTEVGRVRSDARGRLTFVYENAWRNAEGACPLSLSMPLAAEEHGPATVQAFLWSCILTTSRCSSAGPRNFRYRRNVFALISNVGENCAGAIQFVTPDRLQALKTGKDDKIEWLDKPEIANRLRVLREDHAAWRLPRDTGQFCLAGGQPKTALVLKDNKWGIPSGRIPTTHILKPLTGDFDGHADNEHNCLQLARELGLPAAETKVMRFEQEIAIVVERYDRQVSGNDIIRVHQEDICQAMGIPPTKKYQNVGGPTPADVVELLRTYSTDREADLETFVSALVFNWLIGGSDAHAKHYSLLRASGPLVRLAPLYDIASILPYDHVDQRKIKLAMKVGGEYKLDQIGLRQWEKFARETNLQWFRGGGLCL